jgi:hypothetical protein
MVGSLTVEEGMEKKICDVCKVGEAMSRMSLTVNGVSYSFDFEVRDKGRGVRWKQIDICQACALAQLGIYHSRVLDEMTNGNPGNMQHRSAVRAGDAKD